MIIIQSQSEVFRKGKIGLMFPQQIRVITICIIRKGDAILVFEDVDKVTNQIYYRPLGGGIEFGEPAAKALIREFREELDAEIINLRYIETLENIFISDGEAGHQIVMIYKGDFADESFYNKDVIIGQEDNGQSFKALWMPIKDFQEHKFPLYPDGLRALLSKE